jgi:hypothetical protein
MTIHPRPPKSASLKTYRVSFSSVTEQYVLVEAASNEAAVAAARELFYSSPPHSPPSLRFKAFDGASFERPFAKDIAADEDDKGRQENTKDNEHRGPAAAAAPPAQSSRRVRATAIAGSALVVLIAMYVWMNLTRDQAAVAPPLPPGPVGPNPPGPLPPPGPDGSPPSGGTLRSGGDLNPTPGTGTGTSTTDDQKDAEAQAIKDRQKAFDEEQKNREDLARRLAELGGQDAGSRVQQLEQDARTVAGLGYRLRENTSATGAGLHALLTPTVNECALACTQENCAAFAYNRDQYGPASRQSRYCYLYHAPFKSQPGVAGYQFGERDPQVPPVKGAAAEEVIRRAKANPVVAAVEADGLTRCPNGPVKVPGFKLTCEQTVVGGARVVGQNRLIVANINQCAAKCTAASNCTAFGFNSSDPEGEHSCQLVAPGYATREVQGWISGLR